MSSRFRSLENILSAPARGGNTTTNDPTTEARADSQTDDSARSDDVISNDSAVPPVPPPAAAPRPTAAKAPPPNSRKQQSAEQRGGASSSEATGGARRVPFRLDESVYRDLAAYASTHHMTQAEVVFEALERADEQNLLADLVAREKPTAQAGRLFTRPAKRSNEAAAAVSAQIRVDVAAVETIDRLVAATRAESRTQLIVAALRHHFANTDRSVDR